MGSGVPSSPINTGPLLNDPLGFGAGWILSAFPEHLVSGFHFRGKDHTVLASLTTDITYFSRARAACGHPGPCCLVLSDLPSTNSITSQWNSFAPAREKWCLFMEVCL